MRKPILEMLAMSFRIPNTFATLLALFCLLSIAFAEVPESVFYDNSYQVTRGNVEQIDSDGKLAIRNEAGLSELSLDEIQAMFTPTDTADFMQLLTQTNYKTMNRQGFQVQGGIPYAVASQDAFKSFWQEIRSLFKDNDRLTLVISYRILANGAVAKPMLLQPSGVPSLDAAVIDKLQLVHLPALPSEYTGTWIPAYMVLSFEEIEKKLFLSNMRDTLEHNLKIGANADCTYRIRLLYKPDGAFLLHEILGSRQTAQNVEACSLSDNNMFVNDLKAQKPQVFPWPQNDFWGVSVWVLPQSHPNKIWVSVDPTFAEKKMKSVMSDYFFKQFEPAIDKLLRNKIHKEKLKMDWRTSRYTRFLITFSPSSWPNLKEVVMTTPSGDPTLDRICTEALQEIKLQKLPELMNVIDQRTGYKCGLWGND